MILQILNMQKNSILIIKKLREEIFSKDIISNYKVNEQDFTRKRKQSFDQVLLFMLNLLRKSMAIEINNFLEYLNSKLEFQKIESFTSSAFVQKRKKIKPEVFNHLSSVITDNYYVQGNQNIKRFKDFRVLAVDGSKITPRWRERPARERKVFLILAQKNK